MVSGMGLCQVCWVCTVLSGMSGMCGVVGMVGYVRYVGLVVYVWYVGYVGLVGYVVCGVLSGWRVQLYWGWGAPGAPPPQPILGHTFPWWGWRWRVESTLQSIVYTTAVHCKSRQYNLLTYGLYYRLYSPRRQGPFFVATHFPVGCRLQSMGVDSLIGLFVYVYHA